MASFENTNRYVKFVRGTQNAWNGLTPEQIHEDTLYFIYESSSSNTGTLYLGNKKISNSGEGTGGDIYLKDLKDVLLSNINNSEILVYNNGKWINSTIEDILNFDNNVLELDNEGSLTLRGFNSASVGTIPQKSEEGFITWITPGNITEITNIQNQLQQVYTKTEVNNLIANIDRLSYQIVKDLNDIDVNAPKASNYIYLVPAGDSDQYDEYMVINGKIEPVGNWSVDLNNYITTETFNTKVSELNSLIETNKNDITTLKGFSSSVGNLNDLMVDNQGETLVDQVNNLTRQMKWQNIIE